MASSSKPPLSPQEGWLTEGRQVLHFRPTHYDRWSQRLEVVSGELLPDQAVPLLKRRQELPREKARQLWAEKRRTGWRACPPQWLRTQGRLLNLAQGGAAARG
ncbi:MAG: DUF1651 domain-containing protein [Prochlorococcaceae cyanobacterium]|jgi:hypothetical protein